jgi:hypothetical protein
MLYYEYKELAKNDGIRLHWDILIFRIVLISKRIGTIATIISNLTQSFFISRATTVK